MAVLKDIVEQNRKVAVSVADKYGFDVEVQDVDIVILVGKDYLLDNFNRLFVSSHYSSSMEVVDYDDMVSEASDHIHNVIEDFVDYDDDLVECMKNIRNASDFVDEFDGEYLDVVYTTLVNPDSLEDWAMDLAEELYA